LIWHNAVTFTVASTTAKPRPSPGRWHNARRFPRGTMDGAEPRNGGPSTSPRHLCANHRLFVRPTRLRQSAQMSFNLLAREEVERFGGPKGPVALLAHIVLVTGGRRWWRSALTLCGSDDTLRDWSMVAFANYPPRRRGHLAARADPGSAVTVLSTGRWSVPCLRLEPTRQQPLFVAISTTG
jgi:hypothetical protein